MYGSGDLIVWIVDDAEEAATAHSMIYDVIQWENEGGFIDLEEKECCEGTPMYGIHCCHDVGSSG